MSNIQKMNLSKLQKMLKQKYRSFDGKIFTIEEYLNNQKFVYKMQTDSRIKFNRRKFNNMDYNEQRIYEESLKKPMYWLAYAENEDHFLEINKTIFDYVNLPIKN